MGKVKPRRYRELKMFLTLPVGLLRDYRAGSPLFVRDGCLYGTKQAARNAPHDPDYDVIVPVRVKRQQAITAWDRSGRL